MEPNNGWSGAKIALLVDFDNVVLGLEDPGFDIELVVNALRERGTIVLGRVYGDWYRHNRHRRKLMEQGLELVETPAFGPVIKNSADIRIALDGFEIGLTQPHIDTFAIVSGDSDFLPLIKKLQSLGRRVLVICGNRFTSDMLRRNCNEFISYENLLAQSMGASEDATTLDGAFSLLHRAMAALRERGTEIRGSGVKQMMIQLNPVFSERTFGCTQFRQFLQKAVNAGVVKLGPRDKTSGEFHVLLPDEDEAPIQQRVERREENRARRDDKFAQIAARISAVPVPARPSVVTEADMDDEPELSALPVGESDYDVDTNGDYEGGAVFADDAFGYDPEPMSVAMTESPSEIAQNTIARSELLSRGLRSSKRRFSGRGGRAPLDIGDVDSVAFDMEADGDEDDAPVLEVVPEAPAEEAPAPEAAAPPTGESRRLRSRRRRRSASGQITVVAEEPAPVDFDSSAAADGNVTLEFSNAVPSDSDDEAPVEAAQGVEAPDEEMAEIQTALDEIKGAGAAPLGISEGVTVEVSAPALPEGTPEVEAADPAGIPAEAAKPKRRRPARARKAAPEAEAAPAEAPAPVESPAEVVSEPPVEAEAPAKPRRRRPSRAKKAEGE